jgi:hypothetical protein
MPITINLFGVNNLKRTRFQIIIWWELRRIILNLFLLLIIFLGLKIIGLNFLEIEMGSGEYFILLIYIGLALILNFLYTFGWVMELFKKRSLTFAPRLFKKITILSLILFISLISLSYHILR